MVWNADSECANADAFDQLLERQEFSCEPVLLEHLVVFFHAPTDGCGFGHWSFGKAWKVLPILLCVGVPFIGFLPDGFQDESDFTLCCGPFGKLPDASVFGALLTHCVALMRALLQSKFKFDSQRRIWRVGSFVSQLCELFRTVELDQVPCGLSFPDDCCRIGFNNDSLCFVLGVA